MLAAMGAMLGRNAFLRFGPDKIYPNLYVILVGASAARKSTGIKMARNILKEAGFGGFSPNRCRKEALWRAMSRLNTTPASSRADEEGNFDLDKELEHVGETRPANMLLMAPELTAFTGHGDDELFMSLTDLYDNLPDFIHEKTTSKSDVIIEPTLSILAATTPTELSNAIPPSAIGGGFFSRTLFVYGKPVCKVANPDKPDTAIIDDIVAIFKALGELRDVEITRTKAALELLATIYEQEHWLNDRRLESYLGRRFTHLLKLTMLSALAELRTEVTEYDVVAANTYLSLAELSMPNALGHFGTATTSQASSMVLDAVKRAKKPHTLSTLHKALGTDISTQKQLHELVLNLKHIGKVSIVKIAGKSCLVATDDGMNYVAESRFVNQELVTKEERV